MCAHTGVTWSTALCQSIFFKPDEITLIIIIKKSKKKKTKQLSYNNHLWKVDKAELEMH